jgi:hypothetical protein
MKTQEEIATAEAKLTEQIAVLKLRIENQQLLAEKLVRLEKELAELKK